MSTLKNLARALLVLVLAGSGIVSAGAANAAGPRPLFQLPLRCGEQYRLATYAGHDYYDIDMTAASGAIDGQPIYASYAGTVTTTAYESGGAGWYVKINHGGGWETRYLHMRQAPSVSEGQSVQRGHVLGYVGETGNATGPHLHYEQRRDGAKIEAWFNGEPSGITHDDYSYSTYRNSFNCARTVSVYGALADGRLTYTAISADTGERTHGAVVSDASLGFTPKTLATLNFNTLLVTSASGQLYRVDVITNNDSLVFNTPIHLGGGWTHDLLTYDGAGHLYGIADGVLRRYNVSGSKPTTFPGNTVIDGGFTLQTLTAYGPGWILGTTADGRLLSYRIYGAGDWAPHELKSSTWQGMTNLVSPGVGIIYGRTSNGALHRYLDSDPFDNTGADLHGMGTVDDSGWTQILLSAHPFAF